MKRPRLAIVGCGSVTRELHLPAVSGSSDFQLVGLVDPHTDRAGELAEKYSVPWVAAGYGDAIGRVDAVVLALPNHLHAQAAIDFLRAGVHVLVEKPMAPTVAECDRMIEATDQSGRVLAVGLVRRFYEWTGLVAALVRDRPLGEVRRVRVSEGERYRQRVESDFRFRREQAGGGVLADRGIYVLDQLAWWLGECEHVDYRDDAKGGVEAEAHLSAVFAGGVGADVLVTRLRSVPNSCRVDFDRGTLLVEDAGANPAPPVRLQAAGLEWEPCDVAPFAPGSQEAFMHAFRRQLADFAEAIGDGREPAVSGREGRRSVELLERCYAGRRPLEHPWEPLGRAPEPEPAAP